MIHHTKEMNLVASHLGAVMSEHKFKIGERLFPATDEKTHEGWAVAAQGSQVRPYDHRAMKDCRPRLRQERRGRNRLAIYRGAIDADRQAAAPQVSKKLIKAAFVEGALAGPFFAICFYVRD
jgi:hypothetical protein